MSVVLTQNLKIMSAAYCDGRARQSNKAIHASNGNPKAAKSEKSEVTVNLRECDLRAKCFNNVRAGSILNSVAALNGTGAA